MSKPAQPKSAASAKNPAKAPAAPRVVPASSLPPRTRWIFGLVAALLGFGLYVNTVGYDYCLDDFSIIKDNWITKGGLKNLGLIFSTEYRFGSWNSPGSLYRPLSLSMFALEWQLSPDNPHLGHWLNAIFYGVTGWVMWITWSRIMRQQAVVIPALAVLFFLAHPVHTEVVANIKSRDEILSLLFGTLTLYALWRQEDSGKKYWLLLSLLLYAASLFSKESSITLLAIIPLTLWFFSNRSFANIAATSALFLIPAVIFLLIRHQVLAAQTGVETFSELDNFIVLVKNKPAARLASALFMCGQYGMALLFPVAQVSDLGYPQMKPVTFSDWRALLSLVVFVGMAIWALFNVRNRHFLAYAVLFFLFSFSLFSNVLMLIGTSYGERLLYLPSFGLALALAWLIAMVSGAEDNSELWDPNGKGIYAWGLGAILIGLFAYQTLQRNRVWADSFALYSADLVRSPNCAKLNYHMGLEQVKKGINMNSGEVFDPQWVLKGIDSYSKAIELYPKYHDAYGSRGLAYFRLNNLDQAFNDYKEALKYRPNDSKVLSNMGFIYFVRKDLDKAEDVYRKAIKFDPRFVDARRNLGAVLAMQRRFPDAIDQWKEALKIDPNNATLHEYIGQAHKDMGYPDKAQPWLDKAAELAKRR